MHAQNTKPTRELMEVAGRIHELREIAGYTPEEMARYTDVSLQDYISYESAQMDMPFSFIHNCALIFNVGITDLMEGSSASLSSYTVTRRGQGQLTAKEKGVEIKNMAPFFRDKIAEPYWVTYEYNPAQQDKPIHLASHKGQEFDLILSGRLKVQVGENVEVLSEGDSIYYDSSTPHGMRAIEGADCTFLAMILPGSEIESSKLGETILPAKAEGRLIYEDFVSPEEDELGALKRISFKNEDSFNFAFDVVDRLGREKPDHPALLHVDGKQEERAFTFREMKLQSARAANYFKSLGIQKGDAVMLALGQDYRFWFALLGLHKLGAVALPVTDKLLAADFRQRLLAASPKALLCTAQGSAAQELEAALAALPGAADIIRIACNGHREGWHDYDAESALFSRSYHREKNAPCGSDPMLMFFTSGLSAGPKLITHNFKYALAHFVTAKYWQRVEAGGLHFTVADTGWSKALWGKLYGQWLCEAPVFACDLETLDAPALLPLFARHNITTFCAPPTLYRTLIKEDLGKYDLRSIRHATTAGEALNPEVFRQFKKATGLSVMEGYGQTETALIIGNLVGMKPKIGSMGKAVPLYQVDLMGADGQPVAVGETGEIVVRAKEGAPCGLFEGYCGPEAENRARDGNTYRTGDFAWRDEDGFFWYVGRIDDVIKSSGYRIGPFEVESIIMELPYVLECGVSPVPDEARGQILKASVVLTKGKAPSEELKKEIQAFVKQRTAPYKYPRIVEFLEELPKTISGKIIRGAL